MNKSCYERLGVETTADAHQIKRAYYTLVKQYPPERFPEEYKRLRAAYDTLSDEKKRAEYDRFRSLPEDVADLFEQARKLEDTGQHAQSVGMYEQILLLHPELEPVSVVLARSFESQGKNGKAISVWEKLCARAPENAEYAYELALGYHHRGWLKRALKQYRRALTLDDSNTNCWLALLHCLFDTRGAREEAWYVCRQSIQALEKHGKESIRLYMYAVVISSTRDDIAEAERYLGAMVRAMRAGGVPVEDSEQAIGGLLKAAKEMRQPAFVKYIQEMMGTLSRVGGHLQEQLAEVIRMSEIESLEERGFSELFHDMFAALDKGCDCEECRLELTLMECHILVDLSAYRSELLRLRKEFPDLYALHAKFFDEVLRTRDTQKLLYRRTKVLSQQGMLSKWFDEDESFEPVAPVQTIRRTGPKVGRNDPCPCGSGKKYKKCCGQ